MVEGGQLVVVGKAGLGVAPVQILGEFQHIVGIATLRSVDVVDKVHAGILAGEVLTAAVSAEGERPLTGDDIPEKSAGIMIGLVAAQFGDALKSHHFGHLCVGVHIVKIVLPLRHRGEQPAMGEAACHVEVFFLFCDGIGIDEHLVHSAVLIAEHLFHLGIREACGQVDGPVAETQEKFFGLFVSTVEPCVAQTGIHLMEIIERRP